MFIFFSQIIVIRQHIINFLIIKVLETLDEMNFLRRFCNRFFQMFDLFPK